MHELLRAHVLDQCWSRNTRSTQPMVSLSPYNAYRMALKTCTKVSFFTKWRYNMWPALQKRYISRCMLLRVLGRSMWRGWQNLQTSNFWEWEFFNILDTYIFILHNQKCWFQSIKTEKECVCVECFIYCLSFCSFKRHVSPYVISRNVRKYICKFPNILRMQNATDLNHISNESLLNGLSVYI